jgi:polar amino acid transport system substrate-binding protein
LTPRHKIRARRRGNCDRKGSGLVDALTVATNGLIADGSYTRSLTRWGIQPEALGRSESNPPGLPKF